MKLIAVLAMWSFCVYAAPTKYFLQVHTRPSNFTWEDIQLKEAQEFEEPILKEWLTWFTENPFPGNPPVVACDEACMAALGKKPLDEIFKGAGLIKVTLTLHRVKAEEPMGEVSLSFSGGVIIEDMATHRLLGWGDLPAEQHPLKGTTPKELNSAMASLCYRAPLAKFLELKNLVRPHAAAEQTLQVRLEGMAHLGEVLRFQEWVKKAGISYGARSGLDSFSGGVAQILIFFHGEGQKFTAMVAEPNALEWGLKRPVTSKDEGGVLVLSAAPANRH